MFRDEFFLFVCVLYLLFAVAFFTSRRLLIRFSNKLEDAMIKPRDSALSSTKEALVSSSEFGSNSFCANIRLVMPMIPCKGVRSSCWRYTSIKIKTW